MRIIGMVPVYNEADIVGLVIEHLLAQGVELVILDNGSVDGSYEICSRYLNKGILWLGSLRTEKFDFDLLVQRLYTTATSFHPDWVFLAAADEFMESPYKGVRLKEAVEREDRDGYNLIQFDNFEFLPTQKDSAVSDPDVRRRIKHYTWNDDLQFRCWKALPGIMVTGSAGHYPAFPNSVRPRVVRTKYVLRHFPIRSYEQGLKKVFIDRTPRYLTNLQALGRHVHYNNFKPEPQYFIIHSDNLNEYRENGEWNRKKTFDWTWGVQGKRWAHPPKSSFSVWLANQFPFVVRIWKRVFFKKKRLAKDELEETIDRTRK